MDNETTQLSHEQAQRVKLFKIGSILLIALAFFVAILSINEIKRFTYIGDDIQPYATISVSGMGEVFAVPDTAMVSFSVVEEGSTVQAAQSAASERMENALNALAELEISENNIKTTSYSLNPRYEFRRGACPAGELCPPEGERQLVGYELRQSIEVKVEDRELATDVIQALGDVGVQQIGNVQLTIDDEESLKSEARAKAIADAKAKANVLASDLGVNLARIINFNESGNYPVYFAREEGLGGNFDDGAMSAPQLPAGENRIVSNITITYEIR